MRFLKSIYSFFKFNNKNWKAIVLCIFAATIFWIFNALNKNYAANISFPLLFEYDEDQYIAVNPPPESIRLNVSGLGWNLFRKSSGLKVEPLKVALENPAEVKKIVGPALLTLLSPQLEGLQINYVLNDTLRLQVEEKSTRKIMLSVNSVKQNIKRDFGLSGDVVIQPQFILVEGPRSILNAMPDTLQLPLPSTNIDEEYGEDIEVQLQSNLISSNPPTVRVSFPVSRLMEITDTVALKVINLPRGIKSANLVKEITYTYTLPIPLAHSISAESVTATLDLSGVKNGKHKLVPVIKGLPVFSNLLRIDTVEVNFR